MTKKRIIGLLMVLVSFVPIIVFTVIVAPDIDFRQYAGFYFIPMIAIALFVTLPLLIIGTIMIFRKPLQKDKNKKELSEYKTIPCPKCNSEISKTDKICPKCGIMWS